MDWSRLSADDPREFVAQQILQLLWTTDSPWKTIDSVKPDVALIVIDVLQTVRVSSFPVWFTSHTGIGIGCWTVQ